MRGLKLKKKLMFLLMFVIVCSIGGGSVIAYSQQFSIDSSESALQPHLSEWINKGQSETEDKPVILDIRQLGKSNSYLALFITADNSKIGYAHYHKGWNDKLKPVNFLFGTDKIVFREIETNKGKYGILLGINPDFIIDTIKAPITDEELSFSYDVSSNEWFLKIEKIPNTINHQVYSDLELYDGNNNRLEYPEVFIY